MSSTCPTLAPRRVSPLRELHGHHSHVPQADAARQLPAVICRRPPTVVERLEDRHQCLQDHRDHLRACRTALHSTYTSTTLRRAYRIVRQNSLSWGNPRYTTHLVASHRPGAKEDCAKNGYARSPPQQKSNLSVSNGVLLYKQLIRPMMGYACPAWRSAARSHVRRLHLLQSKCLCLATGALVHE
jgi:hypothetical protein